MAKFPIRESDIKVLAQNIATGLTASAAVYPAPPVTAIALQANLDSLITLSDDCVAARAAAEAATVLKNAGLEELTDAMKAVLRYAEDTVDYDDAQLSLLGWAGLAAPEPLEVPGQPRELEVPRQGAGWVFIDWKRPIDGGAVANYKIERRERPTGDWALIGIAYDSEETLTGQDSATDWEYRVIASNKAGDGIPSNTVGRLET
jgi:hypothetical protein